MLQPSIFKGLRRQQGFPKEITTIGDHLLAARLERKIRQKEIAIILNISSFTLSSWEKNRCLPLARHYPQIVDFLGYCPTEPTKTLGQKLKVYRKYKGLTQEAAAEILGIDPGTLAKYESEKKHPSEKMLRKLSGAIRTFEESIS